MDLVIIGGGIMGASLLYHLAELGWTDCMLIEKDENGGLGWRLGLRRQVVALSVMTAEMVIPAAANSSTARAKNATVVGACSSSRISTSSIRSRSAPCDQVPMAPGRLITVQ